MLMATIDCGATPGSVRLTDISADGAAISSGRYPAKGAWIRLQRNEISVQGRIVWATEGHSGISFSSGVDPKDMLRSVATPRVRQRGVARRATLKPCPVSQAEQDSLERYCNLLGISAR